MANEHSQIVPSMQPTSTIADFKFWCQKVLPLVYDDSLSYYEVLNKMVIYLNQVIDNINADTANVAELEDDFLLLQTYVNNFFDDIDQLVTYTERAEAAQTAANASAINAATSASNASESSLAAMNARDAAVTAKQAAETSASTASTAATNANTKASEAAQSAITAQTAQASASQSATLADSARSAAQTAATTATTKASEASTSATNAQTSAASAKQSEADAEELVNSVQESLENIQQNTQDISELKNANSAGNYLTVGNATFKTAGSKEIDTGNYRSVLEILGNWHRVKPAPDIETPSENYRAIYYCPYNIEVVNANADQIRNNLISENAYITIPDNIVSISFEIETFKRSIGTSFSQLYIFTEENGTVDQIYLVAIGNAPANTPNYYNKFSLTLSQSKPFQTPIFLTAKTPITSMQSL